jgi:hypothetical protein
MQTYGQYSPTSFDAKGLNLPDKQDWLVVIGRNRDSDCLANSNFDCAFTSLGGESDDCEVHSFDHWACGWLEIIIVRPDTDCARTAEEIESSLANYPVLDEDDFSQRENDAYDEAWNSWGAREFRQSLVKALDLDEDTEDLLDDADTGRLQEFFESLNSCGDYHEDGAPCIDRSVRNATLEDVTEFLVGLNDPDTSVQPDLLGG